LIDNNPNCGNACVDPVNSDPINRPGFCPQVATINTGSLSTCVEGCTTDADCTTDLNQKCCLTDCGNKICKTPVDVQPIECAITDCPAVLSDSTPTVLCDDGTIIRRVCKRENGQCQWIPLPCPPTPPPVTHEGICPSVRKDFNALTDCTTDGTNNNTCKSDGDCRADQKCCFTGCKEILRCVTPAPKICVAQNTLCIDRAQLASITVPTSGTPTDLPTACIYCTQTSICEVDDNGNCTYKGLEICLQTCKPPDTCLSRSLCNCFLDSTCSWCQWTREFTSDSGEVRKEIFGSCMSMDLSNKCINPTASGGNAGVISSTRPVICNDNTLPPGTVNPADVITDSALKDVFNRITNGDLTAANIQDILKNLGVVDISVTFIATPDCDNDKGRIKIIIDITGTRTDLEIKIDIKRAIAISLNIKETQIDSVDLEQQTTATKKRSGSGTYLVTTQVSPAQSTPSGTGSGYLLTPFWLFTLLGILFFRF